ncbi:MAG TPA: xanthine dehydrogenase family protein molybdopterin-binding subunit [Thermoanaerobaculaceae bacterium]|nr:xanthine dehydrogenase family protein molybdopterin-binding subunit [Thermoanaerobaculaceae bacterium]
MKDPGTTLVEGALPPSAAGAEQPEPWGKTTVVGTRQPRIDGYDRVSGKAVYPSDVILPDMLFGAILRCPHPHATVKKAVTAKAEAMPGVRAVISGASPAADVDWHYDPKLATKLFDPRCRFEGEAVAAVAAETPQQAWDAARAIEVEYEVLPFVADERRALDPAAPRIHDGGNRFDEPDRYRRGDPDAGFAAADKVVELSFHTAAELHTPMELHGCVARWDGARLTLWESTQGVYPVQQRVAATLDLPLSSVRVIGHYMGGGFGSKLQADKYDIVAAVLAKVTARPVKLFLTREETLLCVGNRPPSTMRVRIGAKKDGTLTAVEFTGLGASGAYPAGGAALLDWLARDLYACPNVRCETTDVAINAGPARPFRAPGHPQGAWALEQAIDALAEALAIDPLELRLKNLTTVSQTRPGAPPFTSTGLRRCLVEGAAAFGWAQARGRARSEGVVRRGVGMAAGMWVAGGGGPPSTVVVKLFADGSANLNMGASDIGTGTRTVMAMVVAEELGTPLDRIQVENADTGTTQYATASGGSKTVPTEAPAVRAAALAVKRQLLAIAGDELKLPPSELRIEGDAVVSVRDPKLKRKIAEMQGFRRRGVLVGVGVRGPNPEGKVVNPFAAQFCEVEVNTRTGEVRVLRFLSANESGRVMNRLTYDSQVIGGVTMGIGLALTEERVLDRQTGKMANRNWHDYKIPTALDVPTEIVSLPIDAPDAEANSAGAKGLGEPVTIPTAAAVANAVHDAVGVRVTESPISPMRLLGLLAERRKRG